MVCKMGTVIYRIALRKKPENAVGTIARQECYTENKPVHNKSMASFTKNKSPAAITFCPKN